MWIPRILPWKELIQFQCRSLIVLNSKSFILSPREIGRSNIGSTLSALFTRVNFYEIIKIIALGDPSRLDKHVIISLSNLSYLAYLYCLTFVSIDIDPILLSLNFIVYQHFLDKTLSLLCWHRLEFHGRCRSWLDRRTFLSTGHWVHTLICWIQEICLRFLTSLLFHLCLGVKRTIHCFFLLITNILIVRSHLFLSFLEIHIQRTYQLLDILISKLLNGISWPNIITEIFNIINCELILSPRLSINLTEIVYSLRSFQSALEKVHHL